MPKSNLEPHQLCWSLVRTLTTMPYVSHIARCRDTCWLLSIILHTTQSACQAPAAAIIVADMLHATAHHVHQQRNSMSQDL